MNFETIEFIREDDFGIIYLNRPPFNPLNKKVFVELSELLDTLERNPDIKAILLTGKGDRAFAAGVDIKEMMDLENVEMMDFYKVSKVALMKIENISMPVVAVINGLALGGGFELALSCDLRICSDHAQFGLPEINLGIIPGGGGTKRLQRLIGQGRAKELLFFGETITAQTAFELGIVNKVAPIDEALELGKKWGAKLAAKPPIAMQMLKSSVNTGGETDIHTALEYETTCFLNAYASEDRKEGMDSFVKKRKPAFVGR